MRVVRACVSSVVVVLWWGLIQSASASPSVYGLARVSVLACFHLAISHLKGFCFNYDHRGHSIASVRVALLSIQYTALRITARDAFDRNAYTHNKLDGTEQGRVFYAERHTLWVSIKSCLLRFTSPAPPYSHNTKYALVCVSIPHISYTRNVRLACVVYSN